jgi:hypothetical protein
MDFADSIEFSADFVKIINIAVALYRAKGGNK